MTGAASSSATPELWTTRRLLGWMAERFTREQIDAPRVVAEMLLAHVLDCERMRLYMEVDRAATPEELTRLRGLVARAQADEPVQYITGRAAFFGRELLVDASTMIPQPSTESVVEAVLEIGRASGRNLAIADVATGSGCIAVSVAAALPNARIVATDVVPAALDLARRNAERLGLTDRIEFRAGSLLEPFEPGERFDVICSNPPYIRDRDFDDGLVQASVRRHVPATALRGGADGLDFIRPLVREAGARLAPGGALVIEIAHDQREQVIELVSGTHDLVNPRVSKDYEGLWRVLRARARDG